MNQAPNTVAFRPHIRPPMAILQILDDSQGSAEAVRLRKEATIIGRTTGDIVLPNDPQISSRHAEIRRVQVHPGHFHWVLVDLGSSNGTYVKVDRCPVSFHSEWLIGRGRYRFEPAGAAPAPTASPPADIRGTVHWDQLAGQSHSTALANLVQLDAHAYGRQFPVEANDVWIGSDPSQCQIVLLGDSTVNARHARLHQDPQGHWLIEDAGSLNGVWLRAAEVPLATGTTFLLGEQRFVVKL